MEKYKPSPEEIKKAEEMTEEVYRHKVPAIENVFKARENWFDLKDNQKIILKANAYITPEEKIRGFRKGEHQLFVSDLPEHLQPIAKELDKAMHGPCCLDMTIDKNKHRVRVHTCDDVVRVFNYQDLDKPELTEAQPDNLDDLIRTVIASAPPDHNPVVREKFVAEKNGFAVFVLGETLEKGAMGHPTARGYQTRETLYYVKPGQEPKILFEDHAYGGTPGYPGRNCNIFDLKVIDGKIMVKHNSGKTYSDNLEEPKQLTFDIK